MASRELSPRHGMRAQSRSAPGKDSQAAPAAVARCFVAVWPNPEAAAQLDRIGAQLHRELPGTRRMRRANLHLTLAFIGDLPAADQQRVARAVAQITAAPFDWPVDRIGAFPGARVVWAGSEPLPALEQLAAAVRACLDRLAVRFDRRPFVPHVTLLRDLRRDQAPAVPRPLPTPVRWPVRQPALLRSVAAPEGVRYETVPIGEPLSP